MLETGMQQAAVSIFWCLATLLVACLQSTNPLGKCVEYLQEDLESMAAEQRFWQAEYQTYQARPGHQRSAGSWCVHMLTTAPARLVVPDKCMLRSWLTWQCTGMLMHVNQIQAHIGADWPVCFTKLQA